jgi:Arc/MetJ-type ribon-helix-helix transcriptional regulator
MPTYVIPKAHISKAFYSNGLSSSKYENLRKSIKNGLKYDALSKQAQNVDGVEELFLILESGRALTENVASEELKSLFNTDSFKYVDVVKDLGGGANLRGNQPAPAPSPRAMGKQVAQAVQAIEGRTAPAPAPAEEEVASDVKRVSEEAVSDVVREAMGRVTDKRKKVSEEAVSDVVREAMGRVTDKRRKEIEQEVRRKVAKEFEPAPRVQAPPQQQDKPRARPSASTSSATAPDLTAPAPPTAPAPAPAQAPERKRPKESAILDPTPVTSVDLIPNERRSAEFKTAKQLRTDIEFFFESFPDMLEKEMREYIRVNKTSKKELSRFHRKIMGKLQPSDSVSPEQKKVGIVISADEYIKQAINKALIDAKMLSMNPADVVELSVKGADKKDNTESYGSYEVKKSESGKLAAQKEPIYRYVPKVIEEQEREPRRTAGLQLRQRETKPQTAKRQIRNNPFLQRHTNNVRLKYLY